MNIYIYIYIYIYVKYIKIQYNIVTYTIIFSEILNLTPS